MDIRRFSRCLFSPYATIVRAKHPIPLPFLVRQIGYAAGPRNHERISVFLWRKALSTQISQTSKTAGGWRGRLMPLLTKGFVVASLGIGFSSFSSGSTIRCDVSSVKVTPQDTGSGYPPPPTSSVSLYELGFGTVTGVCAGVFVKKGAKAVACVLGGVFVLLQYLHSISVVRVDWTRAASKFENLFHTKDALGVSRPPNIRLLWNWLVDFLTADFQPRASFIAGFALGLRVG